MTKRKSNFFMCMGCFFKYCKCDKAKNRLPRKLKKHLVRFIQSTVFKYLRNQLAEDINSCTMARSYKDLKPLFNTPLLSFQNEIAVLIQSFSEHDNDESIYIDYKGRLCWYWEIDSDYGGSSGLMPFCYNEKDAGDTWAYSEMHSLIYNVFKGSIGKLPETIKSDKDLLSYIRNNPIPIDWTYDY